MPKKPFIADSVVKKIKKNSKNKSFKTWSRSSTIYPQLIGYTIGVHNGKTFVPVYVTEDMVGHKLGEFAKTRIFKEHGVKGTAAVDAMEGMQDMVVGLEEETVEEGAETEAGSEEESDSEE